MTLTIELPEEIISRLKLEAEAKQETVEEACKRLLSGTKKPRRVFRGNGKRKEIGHDSNASLQQKNEETITEKPKRVLLGYGMLKGVGMSVDEFLAEKHEETRREEEALGWR